LLSADASADIAINAPVRIAPKNCFMLQSICLQASGDAIARGRLPGKPLAA
jgi:hypothetical protein